MSEKPQLRVRLANPSTGAVRFKLPKKGGRWQGPVKNLDAAVQKAFAEGVPTPFDIIYCEKED